MQLGLLHSPLGRSSGVFVLHGNTKGVLFGLPFLSVNALPPPVPSFCVRLNVFCCLELRASR